MPSGQSRTPAAKSSASAASSPAATPDTPTPAPRRSSRKSGASSTLAKRHGADVLAPRTTHYEFGGPVGALGVTLTVPFFTYAFYYFCNPLVGCAVLPTHPGLLFKSMGNGIVQSLTDGTGWAIYFGWYAFAVACWALIPARWEQGGELRTGEKLEYKINGECAAGALLWCVALDALPRCTAVDCCGDAR